MAKYRVETVVFENGERYPILICDDMPHFHVTLWVTSKLRAEGNAMNTISNKIQDLKWFFGWEKREARNLYDEFKRGKFLSTVDIDQIRSYLATDINQQKGIEKKNNKGRNKVININETPALINVTPSVGGRHHYNRMTSVITYLTFLAKLAVSRLANPEYNLAIETMEKRFKAARPKVKKHGVSDQTGDVTLSPALVKEFMAVAHYDHPNNPFNQEPVRFRNHLMFHLMENHGVRKGELLSLLMTDMVLQGVTKSIWVRRTQDDVYDPRINQPVAKTRERPLIVRDETADLINRYIKDYRSKTPNTKKHAYLFVTHRKCATQGQPVSISTFDNTIVPAMKAVDERFSVIHPHYFRHNWNEGYSVKIDTNNELAALGVAGHKHIDGGEEAKMRKQQMGHSSESSGAVYNKRHIAKKSNEVSLMDQEELQKKASEAREQSKIRANSDE